MILEKQPVGAPSGADFTLSVDVVRSGCCGFQQLCALSVCSQPRPCWWSPAPRWTRAGPRTTASRRCTTWGPAGRAPWCSCVSTPAALSLLPSCAMNSSSNKILQTFFFLPFCFAAAGRCCFFLGCFGVFFSVAEFSYLC